MMLLGFVGLGFAFRQSRRRRRSFNRIAWSAARGRHIDVRPNWKEQPPHESLTGKVWRWSAIPPPAPYVARLIRLLPTSEG